MTTFSIPLSEFSGVNLEKIKEVRIGIKDYQGSGDYIFDNIQFMGKDSIIQPGREILSGASQANSFNTQSDQNHQLYWFNTPYNSTQLAIDYLASNSNTTLYIRKDVPPTTSNWDFILSSTGAVNIQSSSTDLPGIWYLLVVASNPADTLLTATLTRKIEAGKTYGGSGYKNYYEISIPGGSSDLIANVNESDTQDHLIFGAFNNSDPSQSPDMNGDSTRPATKINPNSGPWNFEVRSPGDDDQHSFTVSPHIEIHSGELVSQVVPGFDSRNIYKLSVPENTTRLHLDFVDNNSSMWLFAKLGNAPSENNFHTSLSVGKEETIINPTAGDWYFMILNKSLNTAVNFKATLSISVLSGEVIDLAAREVFYEYHSIPATTQLDARLTIPSGSFAVYGVEGIDATGSVQWQCDANTQCVDDNPANGLWRFRVFTEILEGPYTFQVIATERIIPGEVKDDNALIKYYELNGNFGARDILSILSFHNGTRLEYDLYGRRHQRPGADPATGDFHWAEEARGDDSHHQFYNSPQTGLWYFMVKRTIESGNYRFALYANIGSIPWLYDDQWQTVNIRNMGASRYYKMWVDPNTDDMHALLNRDFGNDDFDLYARHGALPGSLADDRDWAATLWGNEDYHHADPKPGLWFFRVHRYSGFSEWAHIKIDLTEDHTGSNCNGLLPWNGNTQYWLDDQVSYDGSAWTVIHSSADIGWPPPDDLQMDGVIWQRGTACQQPVFFDDFESDLGWAVNINGTDTATAGQWQRGNPQSTYYNGSKQLGTTTSGTADLVTGASAGSSAGSHDIDGGSTTIRSSLITLPELIGNDSYELSFNYYLSHASNSSNSDFLKVRILSTNNREVFAEYGSSNDDDGRWSNFSDDISDFAGQTIQLEIEAADNGQASLVEAAIDDVVIR